MQYNVEWFSDNKLLCEAHYSADLPVCKYCNEIIEEDFIEAQGESYHEDHFFCSFCQLSIDVEVFYIFCILYLLFPV